MASSSKMAATEETQENGLVVLTRGNKKAILGSLAEGRWSVWVGYVGTGGEEIGALWFKGFTTCGAEYANQMNARRAAEKFINSK